MRKYIIAAAILGWVVPRVSAAQPSYYEAPTSTGATAGQRGHMGLAGDFSFFWDTTTRTINLVLSSTDGIRGNFGISMSTATFTQWLTASSGTFSSWLNVGGTNFFVLSGGNVGIGISTPSYTFQVFKGTMSADWAIVNSSIVLRGTPYNPPLGDGSNGQMLTTNGSAGLSWTTPPTGQTPPRLYNIIVGTTATFGAGVISTTTAGFNVAITSVGGFPNGGGNIFIQSGDYYWTQTTTVPLNVTMVFQDSAVIKLCDNEGIRRVLTGSGTIVNMNLQISTGVGGINRDPIIDFGQNMTLIRPKFNIRIDNLPVNYSGGANNTGVLYFGTMAVNASVKDFFVSSFTIMDPNAGASNFSFITVRGSTQGVVDGGVFNGVHGHGNNGRNLITVENCDGFIIRNTIWKNSDQLLRAEGFPSPAFMRNFKFINNMVYSTCTIAVGAGLIQFENNSVTVSSGNEISGNTIFNLGGTGTAQTIVLDNPAGNGLFQVQLNNNSIINMIGSTGACFSIGDAPMHDTILRNNYCAGTTTFIGDSGTASKYTSLGNFLGGTSQ